MPKEFISGRYFDPARGNFEPVFKDPPNGVRHIDKTYQDHQPVSERQRVKDAQKREAKNRD